MFAGLIFARDDVADAPGDLVATLPLAGASLIEVQARRMIAAGASRIFVMAGRVTPALTGAIDRLGQRGIKVELAREPADLTEKLRADEPVLAVADGIVVTTAVLQTIARDHAPVLLAVADAPAETRLERLDPQDHWAGIVLVDAALLEHTVAALGEWDLQSTLLRRAAQAGAVRRYLSPTSSAADHAVIATRSEAARADATRMSVLADGEGQVAQRIVSGLVARPLVTLMERRAVPPFLLDIAGGGAGVGGLALVATGWLATGTALILLATLLIAAMRVRALHGFDEARARIDAGIADGLALASLPAVALGLSANAIAPSWTLAAATVAGLVLGRRALAERLKWSPTPVTVALLLFAGAVAGFPRIGLVLVALHTLAALAVAIERLRPEATR